MSENSNNEKMKMGLIWCVVALGAISAANAFISVIVLILGLLVLPMIENNADKNVPSFVNIDQIIEVQIEE